jgi:hypothetical protein
MQWEDHLAVHQCKHEYCYLIDGGDYEEWVDLFTVDGRFVRTGGDAFEGHDELRAMATENFDQSFDDTAHIVTNPLVDVTGETATGRWYLCFVYRRSDGDIGWTQGTYHDQFRKVDGEWRIQEVTVTFGISSPSP